jgi:hypothetical protein
MQQIKVNSSDDSMLQRGNNNDFIGIILPSFFKIPINILMPPIWYVFSSFHSHHESGTGSAQGLTYSGCQVAKASSIFHSKYFHIGPMPAFAFMEIPVKQWNKDLSTFDNEQSKHLRGLVKITIHSI